MGHRKSYDLIETSPDVVTGISSEDDIGCIRIHHDPRVARITSIGWAVLTPNDQVKGGMIELDWSDFQNSGEGPVDESIMYHNVATTLNGCLQYSVVHDVRNYGKHLEDRIYEMSGLKPSWRRTPKCSFDVYGELAIEVGPLVSFRPSFPDNKHLSPGDFALQKLRDYRALRTFTRLSRRVAGQPIVAEEPVDLHIAKVSIRHSTR